MIILSFFSRLRRIAESRLIARRIFRASTFRTRRDISAPRLLVVGRQLSWRLRALMWARSLEPRFSGRRSARRVRLLVLCPFTIVLVSLWWRFRLRAAPDQTSVSDRALSALCLVFLASAPSSDRRRPPVVLSAMLMCFLA